MPGFADPVSRWCETRASTISPTPDLRSSRFLALLDKLRIHPVWTPTEASWLNLIEPHFGVMGRFVLSGSDDAEHAQRPRRVYRYLRYRNVKAGSPDHPLNKVRTITYNKLE